MRCGGTARTARRTRADASNRPKAAPPTEEPARCRGGRHSSLGPPRAARTIGAERGRGGPRRGICRSRPCARPTSRPGRSANRRGGRHSRPAADDQRGQACSWRAATGAARSGAARFLRRSRSVPGASPSRDGGACRCERAAPEGVRVARWRRGREHLLCVWPRWLLGGGRGRRPDELHRARPEHLGRDPSVRKHRAGASQR